MKRLIMPSIFLLLMMVCVHGQSYNPGSEWNSRLWNLQKNGMLVLGSWAAGNFLLSGYQMSQTRERSYYFHQMNVFWNTVNMGIAITGYVSALQGEMHLLPVEMLNEYHQFSKILLINTGLDVAYMMTGLYLKERSDHSVKHQHRLVGYGNSLLLQGGFLFLFDLTLVVLNEQSISKMIGSDAFQLAWMPGSIVLQFNF